MFGAFYTGDSKMGKYVVGIDLETTGLTAGKDNITEIGAVLFDADTWEDTGKRFQTFVFYVNSLPLSEEIKKLTKITDQEVSQGLSSSEAFIGLQEFAKDAVGIVAHRKEFDASFLKLSAERDGFTFDEHFSKLPWVCSKFDVKTHANKACTTLSHLALDYGLTVDGSKLHRAVDDVLLMGGVLQKAGLSFDEILKYTLEPWVYIKALVSFDQKDEAKKNGYSWERIYNASNSPIFPKSWIKRVKESEFENEIKKTAPFKREKLKPASFEPIEATP